MELQNATSVGCRMQSILTRVFGVESLVSYCAIVAAALLHSPGRLHSKVVGDPSKLCSAATRSSAIETDVPLETLISVRQMSVGQIHKRRLQTWPWTVSMNGTPIWFDTADQAAAYVFRHFKRGSRNFEIGCFQLDYRIHAHSFASIEQMFDAGMNAREAAKALKKLHAQSGSWKQAAADLRRFPQAALGLKRPRIGAATLRYEAERNGTSRPRMPPQTVLNRSGLAFNGSGG